MSIVLAAQIQFARCLHPRLLAGGQAGRLAPMCSPCVSGRRGLAVYGVEGQLTLQVRVWTWDGPAQNNNAKACWSREAGDHRIPPRELTSKRKHNYNKVAQVLPI